jgi:ABC-type tungstate transport system permease subunit
MIDTAPTPEEEQNMWEQLERDPEYQAWQKKMSENFQEVLDSSDVPF